MPIKLIKKLFLKTLPLFLSLVIVFNPLAQPEQKSSKTFLWETKSNQSKIYILGSIHLAKDSLYPLDERIEKAYLESDYLVVEININDLDPTEIQERFLKVGMYLDGDTFKNHISSETYDLAAKKLADLGIDVAYMGFYKPWFLAISLVTLELVKLGFDPQKGIDQYFLNKAKGQKPILELESLKYQLDLFGSFTDQEQDLFLLSTLSDLDILQSEVDNMFATWQRGDAQALSELMYKSFEKYPQTKSIYYKLFTKRNKEMVSKIEKYLGSDKTYFVVVGAGHLVGDKGIIALLREKGYQLNQL